MAYHCDSRGIIPDMVWHLRERGTLTTILKHMNTVPAEFAMAQGWVYLAGIYIQNIQGLSPLDTALRILPGAIFGCACSVSACLVAAPLATSPSRIESY